MSSPPRRTHTTTRVSAGTGGIQGNQGGAGEYSPRISADGRYVAFASGSSNLVTGDTNGVEDVFVRDRTLGTTTQVSVDSAGAQANGESLMSAMAADGRFVVFASDSTNLSPKDTSSYVDIYVRGSLH